MSDASGAEITKLLGRSPVPNFLRWERCRTLSNRSEATGSVVTDSACASGSERNIVAVAIGNFLGSGEGAIVFEFHLCLCRLGRRVFALAAGDDPEHGVGQRPLQ